MPVIKFKVAAKTDIGLVRTNNEDNFQLSWDLSVLPMSWINNEMHQLGDKGCLLAVCDGMGGANAGEVASQIAINTIKSTFTPDNLAKRLPASKDAINTFIKDTIILADQNIKKYANIHPETKGMGTTIVIAWILGDKLYVGWCGDSRAYIYNRAYGLRRLTKDHSYVQQLIDAGKLTEDEAIDFPDSNIITQCLSASSQKAKPDVLTLPIQLSCGDTVILCTDGLCGMVTDNEINSVMSSTDGNASTTVDALIETALKASGADNVTVCLCNLISGLRTPNVHSNNKSKWNKKGIAIASVVLLIIIAVVLGVIIFPKEKHQESDNATIITDSTALQVDSATFNAMQPDSIQNASKINPGNEAIKDITHSNTILENLRSKSIDTKSTKDTINNESAEIVQTSETIVVIFPEGKSCYQFIKEYGMNYKDFYKLNPDLKVDSIQVGDSIKVYNKKNK